VERSGHASRDEIAVTSYRWANPVTRWSTKDVLGKLVSGGAKALAGAAAIAGGMALAGAIGGGGAAGAGASGAAGAGGTLGPMTTGGATMLPGGTGAGVAAVNSAMTGATTTMAAAPAVAATAARGGLMSRVGGFLGRNKDIVGNVLAGVGDSMAVDQEFDGRRDLMREEAAITAGNYRGANPSAKYRGLAPVASGPTPTQRFDDYAPYEYRYDAKSGTIRRMPIEPTA
jgi:hypothetical protein